MSSHPSSSSRSFKFLPCLNLPFFLTFLLLFLIFVKPPPPCQANPNFWDRDRDRAWWDSSEERDKFGKDIDETMDTVVNIIIGIVVFFFVAIFVFILCLCCPICMLARMRGRRRGVVYRTTTENNGTTVTTERGRGGTTVTISAAAPRNQNPPTTSAQGTPSVIAISNNHLGNQNKPYPVQESVTVVPVINPVAQQPYYSPAQQGGMMQGVPYPLQPQPHPQQPPMMMPMPQGVYADPPPPYPGLPRETETANLPYNPYYQDSPAHTASAPPAKE